MIYRKYSNKWIIGRYFLSLNSLINTQKNEIQKCSKKVLIRSVRHNKNENHSNISISRPLVGRLPANS